MCQKKQQILDVLRGVPLIVSPTFGTGDVAKILAIPIWRLQKFLDSPRYQLSPEGKLGRGRGSRRMFFTADMYRIAIASRMVDDGFAAAFVGVVLAQIEDSDFWESQDQRGNEVPPPGMLGVLRGSKGPVVRLFDSMRSVTLGQKDSPYYILDLESIVGKINQHISTMRQR